MKPFVKLIGLLLLLSSLWSCNNSGDISSAAWAGQKETSEKEVHALDDFGISIVWMAYKFTNRVSVSGTFEDFTINKENASGSIEGILENLKLSITTENVDSGNAIRDFKLRAYFFVAFNTPTITGTVLNAKDGEGTIKLKMNNVSRNIPYTYSLQNDTIELFTHLDLKNWKGEKALAVLNKECYALHEGADGVSKLWPDVDVVIKLPVNSQSSNDHSEH